MILDRNENFHIFFQNLVNLVVIFRPFSVCIYQYNNFFFKNAVFMIFFLSTWNLTSKLFWDTFICTGDQFNRSKLIFENRPKSMIFWGFFQNFPSIFKIQRSLVYIELFFFWEVNISKVSGFENPREGERE